MTEGNTDLGLNVPRRVRADGKEAETDRQPDKVVE